MANEEIDLTPEVIRKQLMKYEPTMRSRIIEKLILAALS